MVNARSASSSMTATRVSVGLMLVLVLDHFAFGEINDHLADVRRAIGDPLEVLADEREADGAGDVARVLEHVREQLAERLLGEEIDFVVPRDDLPREHGVAADEGVE